MGNIIVPQHAVPPFHHETRVWLTCPFRNGGAVAPYGENRTIA
ncbi:MAG: hypothetical protein ACOY3S_03130 [Pseudomonadota bacterium]